MYYILSTLIVILIIFYECKIHKIEKLKNLDFKKFQEKLGENKKEDLIEQINFWKEKYERSRFNNSKLNLKVVQLNDKLKSYEKKS